MSASTVPDAFEGAVLVTYPRAEVFKSQTGDGWLAVLRLAYGVTQRVGVFGSREEALRAVEREAWFVRQMSGVREGFRRPGLSDAAAFGGAR